MAERFISFYPKAYPPCRLEFINNPKNASQKNCFETIDDEWLGDEVRYQYRIIYTILNGKIEKTIDIFREGECTKDSCPSESKILYCRFCIGDLSDDEVALFEQKSGIANHPDFVLESETDIPLDLPAERYEHQEALNRAKKQFDRYRRNPRHDSDARYMAKLWRIANTIIKSRRKPVKKVATRRSTAERIKAMKKVAKVYWTKVVNGEIVKNKRFFTRIYGCFLVLVVFQVLEIKWFGGRRMCENRILF